ncbi:MAG: hypothetical protein DAHOPDDO_01989 [Ignavibacteriaceae bacterium]|jgi:hypothetical protein|nr:peptidyl-prolyl cis-trans isomerase [Ignavibacteriales bacterium]MBV6420732.1 hypothetical protein [Ignavibacteriaceae bacterium]MEB2297451.1 peptidyl-prolyl cis-trans isomerase [Ignavibacteria bacterium]GIK61745.1 MAG: hypothetical protein BroJett017_26350 [Ignavibacteriota bacterium]MCC7093261.1 peptidyl-prolyl cis-trans isomerase [Ignavibacteriaceae bacterium]
MHLSRKKIIKGITLLFVFFLACNKPETPENYVARVNNSYLSESELQDMVDSQYVSEKYKSVIIKNWVRLEILYQEAVKQGITDSKDFKVSIENSKKELASSILLEKFSNSTQQVVTPEELENYYDENQSSFRLPFNSYFLNRATFTDRESAVMFRTDVIMNGWQSAAAKIKKSSSIASLDEEDLVPEQDIYPTRLIGILDGLYPLEISIVIPDDKSYYTVVQLLDKYTAQSIPPFQAVKNEVERRYKSALTELALENYISDLYSLNEVEIK